MIEHVEVCAYGRPATSALALAVGRAKASTSALAPVTVIVPSNFAGLSARRMLGAGTLGSAGGIANVSFLTPLRLVETLSPTIAQRRLTNPELRAAVRQALASHEGSFKSVRSHRATEAAFAALYAELSHASEASLIAIAATSANAREAVSVHRAIVERLGDTVNEDALADAVLSRPDFDTAVMSLGHVIVFLPDRVNPAIGRLLRSVLAAAPSSAIIGTTRSRAANVTVVESCRRLDIKVSSQDDAKDPAGTAVPTATHIISATDADEEVRAVIRRVVALARSGMHLDRIGIFFPVRSPYLRTLRQQLDGAKIPSNGPSPERLADTAAGRTILAALALPSERWRRDRVMALISDAPVRFRDGQALPTTWERLSRAAGIVGGDWSPRLKNFIEFRTSQLDDNERPLAERVAHKYRRDIADAASLLAFMNDVVSAVTAVGTARTWADKSNASVALLHLLLGNDGDWQRWPSEEQQAAQRVENALRRLGDLDAIDPDPGSTVFGRAVFAELDVARGRSAPFGRGVFYGPLNGGVGHDFDAVFVLGMAEGQCPAPRTDDALLPDSARFAATKGELVLRSARLEDQHRAYLAAISSAPPEHRYLTFPRGDLRGGKHRQPSRWLLDSASAMTGHRVFSTNFEELTSLTCPGLEIIASHAAGLDPDMPSDVTDWEIAELYRTFPDSMSATSFTEHPGFESVRHGLECIESRSSEEFTEWDGNLEGSPIPSPARSGEILSPTRLERWAGCGMRFYLGHVLGLSEREDPEQIVALSALDQGSAVHEILERFIRDRIESGNLPEPSQPWTDADAHRMQEIALEVFDHIERRGLTGRPVLWAPKRSDIASTLSNFLVADSRFRAANNATPFEIEAKFGFDNDPLPITLSDGRVVLFRGAMDRIDRTADDRIIVTDYKTGKGKKFHSVGEGDPVAGGTFLQLGVYSEAAEHLFGSTSTSAYYWLVEAESTEQLKGYSWTSDRRQRFVDVIETIVDGIESGVFPMEPGQWDSWSGTHNNCTYCEFTSICPTARGDQAHAKSSAPQLAVRARLALPEPTEELP